MATKEEDTCLAAKLVACTCEQCTKEASIESPEDWLCHSDNDNDEDWARIQGLAEACPDKSDTCTCKGLKKTSNQKELRHLKTLGKAPCTKKKGNSIARRWLAKHAVEARQAHLTQQVALAAARREKALAAASVDKAWKDWKKQQTLALKHNRGSLDPHFSNDHQCYHRCQQDIPPANASLGQGENSSVSKRLLAIANGAEIASEDHDSLLLLDESNQHKTLTESQFEQFQLLVVGKVETQNPSCPATVSKQPSTAFSNPSPLAVSNESFGVDAHCLICPQLFCKLEVGHELCQLPCNQVHCRACIDPWFAERSSECPTLLCHWKKQKQ